MQKIGPGPKRSPVLKAFWHAALEVRWKCIDELVLRNVGIAGGVVHFNPAVHQSHVVVAPAGSGSVLHALLLLVAQNDRRDAHVHSRQDGFNGEAAMLRVIPRLCVSPSLE